MRGATWGGGHGSCTVKFQSTPLMRGATRRERRAPCVVFVSIHAPHARGDCTHHSASSSVGTSFQSTPLMRGATNSASAQLPIVSFQSTPLMRGATPLDLRRHRRRSRFNPRPSCEGRPDNMVGTLGKTWGFQSTPLMRGATRARTSGTTGSIRFQSTPLMRGATPAGTVHAVSPVVSIHAPHARGDCPRPSP